MSAPDYLLKYLEEHGYHPRSDAHSNAVCHGLLQDLLLRCEIIRKRAAEGRLVAQLNHTVIQGHERWNIDLALGPPAVPVPPPADSLIQIGPPSVIEIAVEIKGVMTEHGKARHNRLRDFGAFHEHAHRYDKKVIAAGIVVVNVSEHFWSPTRSTGDVTLHRNMGRVGKETIELYRSIPLRSSDTSGPGLEAFSVIVVQHDNLTRNPAPPPGSPDPAPSQIIAVPPAPGEGDPLHYSALLHRICTAYQQRWS